VPVIARALTIAGSDSGGGAGIQADLNAFARCGVYGCCAITAVTAQNTQGVFAIHAVPAEVVRAQIEAVVGDIGIDAVKIGMLGGVATVEAVARCLEKGLEPGTPIVVDPLLFASTGAELLAGAAVAKLISEIVPLASVLTPNLAEARALLAHVGHPAADSAEDGELARALLDLGPRAVVLTGGHRARFGDIYCDAGQLVELDGERYESRATHGSGCTHAAVLAAELARGRMPLQAARIAAQYAAEAIRDGLDGIGDGAGPVDVLGRSPRIQTDATRQPAA
jgi:hydroxymethylpyrimidine/phosphomethylpyrimidine kinase